MSELKAKRGRPTIDNKSILSQILESDEKKQQLFEALDKVIESRKGLDARKEKHTDLVSSCAETTGLAKGFLNQMVSSIIKGDGEQKIQEANDFIALVGEYSEYSETGEFDAE